VEEAWHYKVMLIDISLCGVQYLIISMNSSNYFIYVV
jgi:hypothetical protein